MTAAEHQQKLKAAQIRWAATAKRYQAARNARIEASAVETQASQEYDAAKMELMSLMEQELGIELKGDLEE